jgi:PAS domain S-box-containing protein
LKLEIPRFTPSHAFWLSRAIAIGVFLLAAVVVAAWVVGNPLHKSVVMPSEVAMNANTAVGLAMASLALWLLVGPATAPWRKRFALGCALAVAALGAATLTEYLLGTSLGIDRLLGGGSSVEINTSNPGRMAPETAFNLVLIGAALCWMTRPRLVVVAQALAVLVAMMSLFNLIGYVYGAVGFYKFDHLSSIGSATAVAFVALGVGVICARPEAGMMRSISSELPGGVVIRRLLLAVLLLPLVFSGIELQGEHAKVFNHAYGTAVAEVTGSVVLMILIWRTAKVLERKASERKQVEQILHQANERLEQKVSERTALLESANLSLTHEITERKQAEAALRQEESLFASLAKTIPDHIYFKDRQSRFIRINEAMARSFELRNAAEAVGKTDFDIFTDEHARQAYADEQRIMETGEPKIGIEEKETWPDGHVTWVSTTKMPLRDARGCITGLVGISRDITERRLADAQLREQGEILSKSHEGLMIVNLANEISLWNLGAEEIFGWNEAEALGRLPEELLGIEDRETVSALRATAERDGFWNGEIRMKDRKNRNLIIDGRITLVRDEAGRPRARLNFLADITEKKLLEEKFLHAQRLESIGMLAAGIAHDLNNVLAPIMFAEPLLRASLSTPRDLKILDTFKKCAERGAGLVRQILGFVHSTAGEVQPTQVKHIARDIISVIEETFPKSIELQYSIPTDLWPALGNATQIHQVLLNLCVNARDAMPKGGTLRITAANRRLNAKEADAIPGGRPGAWLVLGVTDTGTGIPPDVLEKIWTPFFTTKDIGKGTGLGLSTVRGIVANHHGFVELRTEVGRGTTFRVFLPAVESELPQPSSASPFDIPDGHGELILLVDDDAAIRSIATAILEKHGYRVVSCVDGVEAIVLFITRAGEISLVITDVDMPRLGGMELARTLSQIRPDIRLLAISGLSPDKTGGSAVSAAIKVTHAFLLKPFDEKCLLGAVHRLLYPSEKT